MEITDEFIFSMDMDKENRPFICQCVIGSGSNTESDGKNGLFHLIEHYVINSSYENDYFGDVKIHGYTYFYFTCYYWYSKTKEEAVASFRWFRDVLENICNTSDYRIFDGSKKQIEEEIERRKDSTETLYKIMQVIDEPHDIRLPIGNIELINKLQHDEVVAQIKKFYLRQNMHRFIYNRSGRIFTIENDECVDLDCALRKGKIDLSEKKTGYNRKFGDSLQIYHQGLASNSIKIVLHNNFSDSLVDVICGEMFLMLLCQYISNCICLEANVQYEKLFLSKEKMNYVVNISELGSTQYSCLDCIRELSYKELFNNIVDENMYIMFRDSIIGFLQEDESTVFNEEEIREDLINYALLSYPSYNLSYEHMEIIDNLSRLNYIQFKSHVSDIFFAGDVDIKIIV